MPIPVSCPACNAILHAVEEQAGKSVRCPHCQYVLTVPSQGIQTEPPPVHLPTTPLPRGAFSSDEDVYPPIMHRQDAPAPMAIVSLVLGVVGLLTVCLCGIFGIPIPIVAIVFGVMELSGPGRGLAITGIILGCCSLVFSVGLLVFAIAMQLAM